jgi:hypothetical protein
MNRLDIPSPEWSRFIESLGKEHEYALSGYGWYVRVKLQKEHGSVVWEGDWFKKKVTGVRFDTEEDLLAFKLKY